MQGLSVPVVTAALIASVGLPMVALNVADVPGDGATQTRQRDEELVLAAECEHYADRVAHYRMRLMGAYEKAADRERERELLMYYERALGRDCAAGRPSG